MSLVSWKILATSLALAGCETIGDEGRYAIGHEFDPGLQEGTLRFSQTESGTVTEYEINEEDCLLNPFSTHVGELRRWRTEPTFWCQLSEDANVVLALDSPPSSSGWPEETITELAVFRFQRGEAYVELETEFRTTLTRAEGEVLTLPDGDVSDTAVEATTDDYLREYTVEAEVDCSDDPDCDGVWTLELRLTQTAADVVPVFSRDD